VSARCLALEDRAFAAVRSAPTRPGSRNARPLARRARQLAPPSRRRLDASIAAGCNFHAVALARRADGVAPRFVDVSPGRRRGARVGRKRGTRGVLLCTIQPFAASLTSAARWRDGHVGQSLVRQRLQAVARQALACGSTLRVSRAFSSEGLA